MPHARLLAAAALALPLALTAALAAEPPAPARDKDKQTIVCRGGQKSLSSRIRTPRRCRPAQAWQAEDDQKSDRLPIGAQVTQGQNDGRSPAQPR